jgi:hypothetical protein
MNKLELALEKCVEARYRERVKLQYINKVLTNVEDEFKIRLIENAMRLDLQESKAYTYDEVSNKVKFKKGHVS